MDAHFDSFEKIVLPILTEHKIGVLGMKPIGDSVLLRSETATAEECLRYVLNLPTSVVITGCESMELLQQALRVARSFRPLGDEERAALLAK
ncbi:MAG: aldo/keto reductase, partial [Candidatus Acidiferrales bacterium]